MNGDGARYVIFVQGCAHHCEQCQNPDTWDFNGGQEISVDELAHMVKAAMQKHPLDGVTFSGGDPMYQQERLLALLKLIPDVNVWLYTGFELEEIKGSPVMPLIDAVVCGKFVPELKCEGKMYGSSNQAVYDTHTWEQIG